jgi:hypothetical protein
MCYACSASSASKGRAVPLTSTQASIISEAYRAGAGNPYQGTATGSGSADSTTGERLPVAVRTGVGEALGRARNEAESQVLTVD